MLKFAKKKFTKINFKCLEKYFILNKHTIKLTRKKLKYTNVLALVISIETAMSEVEDQY